MHETAIANKIITEARKQKTKISFLGVEVGELAEVEAHEIEEALKNLTKWSIKVNEKESKIKCSCGYEGRANIIDRGHGYCIFNCPKCENKPNVLDGRDIRIIKIE